MRSAAGQDLLTVLHYRTPISVGVAAVLAIVAVGGALMIGRTGQDERVLDRAPSSAGCATSAPACAVEHRAAARAQRTRSDSGGPR